MHIDDAIVESVRERADILTVMSHYTTVEAKHRAQAKPMLLSPFQSEKTPSCSVNVAKGVFKCFSTGNGGDVFKVVMLREGLKFPDAVKRVADMCNIAVSFEDAEKERKETTDTLTRYYIAAKAAAQAPAHAARIDELCAAAGIKRDWVAKWAIGYVPTSPLLSYSEKADKLRLVVSGGPGFASDALLIPLTNQRRALVGFAAFNEKRITYSGAHLDFRPATYIFRVGTGQPILFRDPVAALSFLCQHPGTPVASTLGVEITLPIFSFAMGVQDTQRESSFLTTAAAIEAAKTKAV